MEIKLGSNGIEYTFLEDGSWFFKAVPFVKKQAETPQIKMVEEIEKNYQEFFNKRLVSIVKDITKYLA